MIFAVQMPARYPHERQDVVFLTIVEIANHFCIRHLVVFKFIGMGDVELRFMDAVENGRVIGRIAVGSDWEERLAVDAEHVVVSEGELMGGILVDENERFRLAVGC